MAFLTYLPFKSIYMIKMVSVIFDIVMIFSCLKLADEIFHIKEEKGTFIILYSVMIFLPTVIINSSYWGQCDSVYTAFCILTIVYICKEDYRMAFIFYGMAFAFKLQSVFLLPILLILYVRKKFSILYFCFVPVINLILCLPAILVGRPIIDVILIYGKQMVAYPEMSLNYPNIYQIIRFPQAVGFMALALAIALLLLGIYAYMIVKNKMDLNRQNILRGSIWCVWTCCMFLPMMHERYSYMMEVLLVLYAFMTKKIKWGVSAAIVNIVMVCAYNHFLFNTSFSDMKVLAVMNLVLYAAFSMETFKNIKEIKNIS